MKKEKLVGFIAAGVALLAAVLWLFLDALSFTSSREIAGATLESTTKFSGLDVLVGIEETTSFNLIALVALVLVVVGILASVLGKKGLSKIAMICFAVAGVLVVVVPFALPLFYTDDYKNALELIEKTGVEVSNGIPFTAILMALLMFVAAAIAKFQKNIAKLFK